MNKVEIPIGPQHPALKEPEQFILTLDGEVVTDAKVNIGFIHRGIEKLTESRSYIQNMYLIERICGICSYTHTVNFAQNAEKLLNLSIPKRAEYIRTICMELERLHSHLLWIGVAGHQMGFDTIFMLSWQDREIVQDLLEEITGNRVNYGLNAIGGVRRDITENHKTKILHAMDFLEKRSKFYNESIANDKTVIARTQDVGKLSKGEAIRLSAVGPTIRASGLKHDIRKDDPYSVYEEIDFDVITHDSCDVHGRIIVRILELFETIKIIREAIAKMPQGEIKVKAPRSIPEGSAISHTEAPRGEDFHYLKSNGTDKPDRYKIRTPTMANLPSVIATLKGSYLADVPITIAGSDPCMGCMDRVIVKKEESTEAIELETLRKYGILWHKGGNK